MIQTGQPLITLFNDCHDQATHALRVVSSVTAVVSGEQQVDISSIDDSVAIGDAAGNKVSVTNNALNVSVVSGFSSKSGLPAQIAVTGASTQLLAGNAARKYAHFINNSSAVVFIQFGSAAVIGQGIKLNLGAMYSLSGFELWQGAVNAVSASGTVNIDIFEGI